MATSTVILITGVSRGIGKALVEAYLLRPNNIVIGSVRDKSAPKNAELKDLPTAEGSRLILVSIESASRTDPAKAIEEIQAAGVTHVDVAIANAGAGVPPAPPASVDIQNVIDTFNINTFGPILLFQAVKPLLDKSAAPKWLSISSGAGSIASLEKFKLSSAVPYGGSKAALNYFTVAVHAAYPEIIAFTIHPGFVQTDMGNAGARLLGMEQAPETLEQSITKITSTLDTATREKTSGKFWNVITDTELPW